MLHLSTVEPHTLELLSLLQQTPELADTRLVGGTSLALQIGHRCSVDIDLFGHVETDHTQLSEALLRIGNNNHLILIVLCLLQ